jgi:hypothetical protein
MAYNPEHDHEGSKRWNAMMDQLIRLAEELENRLRDLLDRFSSNIRGVFLDVDSYWEYTQLGDALRYDFPNEIFYRSTARIFYSGGANVEGLRQFAQSHMASFRLKTDLGFRPADWDEHCRNMNYPQGASPVIIKVILKRNVHRFEELPARLDNYPIIYEVSYSNHALSFSGLLERARQSIRSFVVNTQKSVVSLTTYYPRSRGTLGGVLKDSSTGAHYMVTCGHVAGQVDLEIHNKRNRPSRIGIVRHVAMPPLAKIDGSCGEALNPSLRSIDLSLAELRVPLTDLKKLGAVYTADKTCTVSEMRINFHVSFHGKTSGIVQAKIGPLTIWDEITFNDGKRCFGRIFQLKPIDRQYIHQDLGRSGDSGSWIIYKDGNFVNWYGMLISSDDGYAYGCFAEYIMDECRRVTPRISL